MRIAVLLLAAASFAAATEITFDTLPKTNQNGTYNGFVGGTMNGLRFDDLICDDFIPTTYVPSGPWQYEISFLTGPDALEFARFGSDATAKVKYQQAALLLLGDGTQNLPGLANVDSAYDITSYQYALWRIFTPDSAMGGHGAVAVNPGDSDILLSRVRGEDLMNPGFQSDYSRLRIYTPASSAASNQEFVGVAGVPEPGTWAMAAAGVLALGLLVARRRWHQVRESRS